jgi:hypothetical protein
MNLNRTTFYFINSENLDINPYWLMGLIEDKEHLVLKMVTRIYK